MRERRGSEGDSPPGPSRVKNPPSTTTQVGMGTSRVSPNQPPYGDWETEFPSSGHRDLTFRWTLKYVDRSGVYD